MQTHVLEYFENGAAKRCPDTVAIIHGDASYTFSEVERYAKQLATLLIRRRDVLCNPICVFLGQSAETILADLGILYSGNIYCNLDIKSPPLRTKDIIDQVRPVLILTSSELAPQLLATGVDENLLFLVDGLRDPSVSFDSDELWRRLNRVIDTDPVCIIHTSGSTGLPKGVVLSHRGTIDFMDWCFQRFTFRENERIGSLSPFHFDIYTLELNLCLAKGATIVIVPGQITAFPVRLVEFLSHKQISFLFWVPSIMVNISKLELLNEGVLPALRTIFFAGEVFPMKHLNYWRCQLPEALFVNLYGPIEITVDCTYFVVDRAFRDDESLPIGIPCRNSDILILNERDESCGAGELGELCVRGSSLAMGYWNDSAKTAQAFVQNPLNSKYPERIYRTGDLVFRTECGEIMFVGRKDFQIKHMGYRIELPGIEQQMLAITGITNACVLYNEAQKEITAFYETAHDVDLTPSSIRKALMNILPKYMLPAAFHRLSELPRNPNGKIDRNGLKARLSEMETVES
jgi:D-alanine--poly(phosphoribitol) ligase subunit 1